MIDLIMHICVITLLNFFLNVNHIKQKSTKPLCHKEEEQKGKKTKHEYQLAGNLSVPAGIERINVGKQICLTSFVH